MSRNLSSKDKFPLTTDGVKYNIYTTYPASDVEVYELKLNNVLMFTCTITYTDATKEQLSSVEWT